MDIKIVLWISACLCTALAATEYDQFLINQDDIFSGELIFWNGCSSDVQPCDLTCVFLESDDVISVNWTMNGNGVSPAPEVRFNNSDFTIVISYLSINTSLVSNYTCSSYSNDTLQIQNHTFPITLHQKPPVIGEDGRNMTYVITGSGQCTIELTCSVIANPVPEAYIIEYNSNSAKTYSTSFSTGNIMDSYTFKTTIQTVNGVNGDIQYACVAGNAIGITASLPIQPYVPPGVPVLNQNEIPVLSGQSSYDLTCSSSGGFPAPQITWSLMVNGSPTGNIPVTAVLSPVDHGTSSSTVTFDAQYANVNTTVRCQVWGKTKNYTADAIFIPATKASIVYTKSCTPSNFYSDSSCTLECRTYSPYGVSAKWLYMATTDQSAYNSYQLSPLQSLSNSSNYYTASLTLTDYRDGYYQCQVNSSGTTLKNVFHISQKKGSSLDDLCVTDSDCLPINSKCIENKCKCTGDYPVPMNSLPTTPACLPKSSSTGNCTYDSDCNVGYDIPNAYTCDASHVCSCTGPSYYHEVDETGHDECIYTVAFGDPCYYDEQCEESDENMYCQALSPGKAGYCNCISGYQYYYAYEQCYSIYGQYLSVSAALGIAFGVVLLICIIFVFVIILTKSHSRRTAANRVTTDVRINRSPEFVNINNIDTSYPMESPPSYGEIRRSETPPPVFDDSFDLKFDSSTAGVLFLVNNNYSEEEKTEVGGATNDAMEHEA